MSDNCMTPWDTQTNRVFSDDSPMATLSANSKAGMNRQAVCFQQNQRDEVRMTCGDGDCAGALSASSGAKNTNYVCMADANANAAVDEGMTGTLKVGGDPPTISDGYVVRRLMPVECERLQGFPDGWTDIEFEADVVDWEKCPDEFEDPEGYVAFLDNPVTRRVNVSDTARYKALGNSMAVPVMRWIGERIDEVEKNEQD